MVNNKEESILTTPMSRRAFLKVSGIMGAAGAAAITFLKFSAKTKAQAKASTPDPLESNPDVSIIRSICLMCHSGCGIQCKVKDGTLIKIDGNPYDPRTKEPHLDWTTAASEADINPGTVCPKGASGMKELYNPYRVLTPLRRVGPRGSGKWESITWDEALTDIVEGSTIGSHTFKGLAELRDVTSDITETESPWMATGMELEGQNLGKFANTVIYTVGRSEHGRKELTDRFWGGAFGTVNKRIDHTSICEASHHVGFELCYRDDIEGKDSTGKDHLKPDIMSSEHIIFFGTNPLEANFPMQALARKLMNSGTLKKLTIVDPRFSNSASKAHSWIPIKMGTDAAFALGMARYMLADIDNRCNTTFLKVADGKTAGTGWSDASYLVYTTGSKTGEKVFDSNGDQMVYDVNTSSVVTYTTANIDPQLLHSGEYTYDDGNGPESCKTVIQLFKERVNEHTMTEYAAICGVSESDITDAAKDFCGETGFDMTKCCADHYRGVVKHTNGTYNSRAIIVLNILVGNLDTVGGMNGGGGHWHETGGKTGNAYDMGIHPGKVSTSGPSLSRFKNIYPGTTYPAARPWFPLALFGNFQEVIPSIGMAYPYKCNALFNHMGNSVYSIPGGTSYAKILKDETKVPLFVSFTVVMGENDALSDYILPERHYLERYSTTHAAPTMLTKISSIRQPVVSPVAEGPRENGDDWNMGGTCLEEDVCIELAHRIAESSKLTDNTGVYTDSNGKKWLPGFGPEAFGSTEIIPGYADNGLENAYDWFKKLFINIYYEEGTAPTTPTEADAGLAAMLKKGGRFENHGGFHKTKYHGVIYSQKLLKTIDSMTGTSFDPLPVYEATKDVYDNPVDDGSDYPFLLNTYKKVFHTQSRTATNPWLMMLEPENHIELNSTDAAALLIEDGDMVKVSSVSNTAGIIGKAKLVQNRPGIVSICHSYGHWESGSRKYEMDGTKTKAAPWIGTGVSANPVERLDPVLGDVCLQDKIGGSASYYDTHVKVERV